MAATRYVVERERSQGVTGTRRVLVEREPGSTKGGPVFKIVIFTGSDPVTVHLDRDTFETLWHAITEAMRIEGINT